MKYKRYDNHCFEGRMNMWFVSSPVCIEYSSEYSIWIDFTKTSKTKHIGAAFTFLMNGV